MILWIKAKSSVRLSLMIDHNKGVYYFAMKDGDKFIDPIQVISFE